MSNYFANIGKSDGIRDAVDRYETPSSVTRALLKRLVISNRVADPACGTGRIVRVLKEAGHTVVATDIVEDGIDFRKTIDLDYNCEDIVTNPPYKDGLAEEFVRHALDICPGTVAMLLRTGFLGGQARYGRLHSKIKPSHLFFLCKRVKFFKADGSRISGQAHDHVWVVYRGKPKENVPPIDFISPKELHNAG